MKARSPGVHEDEEADEEKEKDRSKKRQPITRTRTKGSASGPAAPREKNDKIASHIGNEI